MPPVVQGDVPLAPLTTLELGGPARHFVEAATEALIVEGARHADRAGLPLAVLGGGSNLVVADSGWDGLVLAVRTRGLDWQDAGDRVLCDVAAGEPWDGVVAEAVTRDLEGLECLSGIPGLAGATPIQNVGAYGQEVSDTIRFVRAYDRAAAKIVELAPDDCGFAYRSSRLRREPGRFVVLSVRFELGRGLPRPPRHPELSAALAAISPPRAGDVRRAVLAVRRAKSMVIDPADPNRRSAGSFFLNPIVPAAEGDRIVAQALREGLARDAVDVPCHPVAPDKVKLAAAWLIERAGFDKGLRAGAVGLSNRHALALVHHGGGTTAELVALARRIADGVRARFGLTLEPEPTLLGIGW